ncbi:unnamed protein product, partial [Onchocerca ochengi]|uniref:C2 tensin-type domain-containing protein n=1 Tax=Onchocerca ochengi TaxID=42157 RepID=A0A182EVF7_ONCOC
RSVNERLSNDKEFNKRIPENDLNKKKKETFFGLNWNYDTNAMRLILKVKQKVNKKNDSTVHRLTICPAGILDSDHGKIRLKLPILLQFTFDKIDKESKITRSHWLYAKSRIVPIKDISFPKVELLSILIRVRTGQVGLNQLWCREKDTTVWSDAKCALFWVKPAEEIRSSRFKLRYLPTSQNPTEMATRGISPPNFIIANYGGIVRAG